MTVYKRQLPLAKIPAARPAAAADPPVRSEPPPAAEQSWPLPESERDMFEVMYCRAVATAFKRQPPPVEEDPHDWVWN